MSNNSKQGNRACKDCFFAESVDLKVESFKCRFSPPTTEIASEGGRQYYSTKFPMMDPDDYCFQFSKDDPIEVCQHEEVEEVDDGTHRARCVKCGRIV